MSNHADILSVAKNTKFPVMGEFRNLYNEKWLMTPPPQAPNSRVETDQEG